MNNSARKTKLKKLLTLAAFAVVAEQQEEQEIQRRIRQLQNRQRRWWTREWIVRREFELRGSVHLALNELINEDIESFCRFFRMDLQLFNNLLDKVSPYIQKQDTVMRKCIPPIQRLSLTLRFLATGESFRNMEFATRVPACTLSRIIPEIVRVIYEVLKD
ncbi:PREDICTED: uncharacterized protein LOC108770793 [Trachymyrmex cornetzi]|uniref:uncharacterized protein LOC108770793 n=1 Tax=Trachymyrmex cornetzi TaxID=471704 RepID=UPI00084F3EA0|nr:PREDICTED: uncharacterized protein LOC108770793 [Trachymyrmex cornetzi]